MGDEDFWRSAGGVMQLLGVALVAYGVMALRDQLDPDRSVLAAMRRTLSGVKSTTARIAEMVAQQARQRLKDAGRRLRGLPPLEHRSGSVNIVEGADVSSFGAGQVSTPPEWDTLDLAGKIDLLRSQVSRLQTYTVDMRRNQQELADQIRMELSEVQTTMRELHLGGLTLEGIGAALIAVGIASASWPHVPATYELVPVVVVGPALLASGWWLTSEDRRFWRPQR
jgi:hypothetical protein